MRHMPRTEKILNIIMVIFALIGIVLMVTGKEDGMLTICFTRTPEQPGWKDVLTKGIN